MPFIGISPPKTGVQQQAREQDESGNSNSAPGASGPSAEESAQLAAAEKASQRRYYYEQVNALNGLDENGKYVGIGKLSWQQTQSGSQATPLTPSAVVSPAQLQTQQTPTDFKVNVPGLARATAGVDAQNVPNDRQIVPSQPQGWTAGTHSQRTDSPVGEDGTSSATHRNTSGSDNGTGATGASTAVAAAGVAAGRVAGVSAAEEKSAASGEPTTDNKKETSNAEDEPKSTEEQLAQANADALALSKWGSVGMGLGQMALNPIMAASSPFKRAPVVAPPETIAVHPQPAPNPAPTKPVAAAHVPVAKPAVEDDAIKSATKAWQQKASAAAARIAGRESELAAKNGAIWTLAARLNPPDAKIDKLQEEVKSLAAQNKADKAIIEKAQENGRTRLLRSTLKAERVDAQKVVQTFNERTKNLKAAIAANEKTPLELGKQLAKQVVANPRQVVTTVKEVVQNRQELAKNKAVLKLAEARLERAEQRVASVNEQLKNLKNAPAVKAAVAKSSAIVSTPTPAPATPVSTATVSTTASAPASSTKPASSLLGKVTNAVGEKLPRVAWSPVRMVAKVGSTAVWGVGTAVSGYFTYQEAQRAAEVAKSDAPPFQKVLATSTAVLSGYATSVSAIAYVGILPAMGLASLSAASATLEAILY